jgi:ABC-type transport system involved in multi-copper enzyme maturation permease subunit
VTTPTSTAPYLTAALRRGREPKARFIDLCHMEWIKIRSLRSTWWVLIFAALATIFININGVRADLVYIDRSHLMPDPDGIIRPWQYDPLWKSLSDIAANLVMLGASAVGALTMFGEFSTGQIRTTFVAVPHRDGVVAAKVAVLAALTTVLGLVVAVASFSGGQALLASRHLGLGITDPEAMRSIAAYTLVVPVCALVGMLFGALIRNATASIVGVVAFLFLVPAFFGGDKYRWVREIGKVFPGAAERRLTWWSKGQGTLGKWPESVTEAWLVYGGWALVCVVATLYVVKRRDA